MQYLYNFGWVSFNRSIRLGFLSLCKPNKQNTQPVVRIRCFVFPILANNLPVYRRNGIFFECYIFKNILRFQNESGLLSVVILLKALHPFVIHCLRRCIDSEASIPIYGFSRFGFVFLRRIFLKNLATSAVILNGAESKCAWRATQYLPPYIFEVRCLDRFRGVIPTGFDLAMWTDQKRFY